MKSKLLSLSIVILIFSTFVNAQTLTSVDPSSASQCQKLAITLTGENTNFYQATSTMWLQDGETGYPLLPSSQTVLSETQLVAEFCFSPADEATVYDVHAFNGVNVEEMVLENGFELLAVENLPELTNSSPATANLGETITLSILGQYTHFNTSGVTNEVFLISPQSQTIFGSNINVIDDENLEATFILSAYYPDGYYKLLVRNCLDDDVILLNAINIIDNGGGPEIVSVDPNSGTQGEQLTLTITGQNTEFQQGSSSVVLENDFGTIYGQGWDVENDTLIHAYFNFTYNDIPGIYDVSVRNYNIGNVSLPDGFTLNGSTQPSITEIIPANTSQGTAQYFTIKTENTTYNTEDNMPYVILSQDWEELYPKEINLIDSLTIEAKFIISYSNMSGYRKLTISSPFEGTMQLDNAVYIEENTEGGSVSKVVPDTAVQGETINISITGKDIVFMQGTSNISLSKDNFTITPNSSTVINDSMISGEFSFSQSFPDGKYDVVVEGDYAWPDVFLNEGFELKLFNFIGEEKYNSYLSVYPNPCDGILNIKRLLDNNEDFIIKVFSLDAKLLFEDNFSKSQTEKSYDLSFLSKGNYILNVIMGESIQSSKLIIQ